jgi:hypothetical protein
VNEVIITSRISDGYILYEINYPLGISATNWPTVPAPGDYEDGEFGGMMIGRGNRSIL